MRLALIADIHGNLPALQAVITHMQATTRPDDVLILGDLVSLGTQSVEVVARVRAFGWPTLRGNHAYYALDWDTPRQPPFWQGSPVGPWMMYSFGGLLPYLATLPDAIRPRYPNVAAALAVHAAPGDNRRTIFPTTPAEEVAEIFAGVAERTIFTAHTHLPTELRLAGYHLINPGAVGLPFDGDTRAAYCIVEGSADGWRAEFHRVAYDLSPLLASYEDDQHRTYLGDIVDLFKMQVERAAPIVFGYSMFKREHYPELPFGHPRSIAAFLHVDPVPWFSEPYRSIHG